MSRLSDLYKAIETMRREGLSTEDLERKVSLAEEEIIKKEILPVLTQNIEPALQQVKRELVLVVDYQPGNPLTVHISRKRNFTAEIPDAKEIVQDPPVEHGSRKQDKNIKIKRSAPHDMVVYFPDGTKIEEGTAAEILTETVKKIGVERVRKIVEEEKLTFDKVPVISNRRDAKYGRSQKALGNGWLLITHCSNKTKKAFIEKIAKRLNLDIRVVLKNEKEGK